MPPLRDLSIEPCFPYSASDCGETIIEPPDLPFFACRGTREKCVGYTFLAARILLASFIQRGPPPLA